MSVSAKNKVAVVKSVLFVKIYYGIRTVRQQNIAAVRRKLDWKLRESLRCIIYAGDSDVSNIDRLVEQVFYTMRVIEIAPIVLRKPAFAALPVARYCNAFFCTMG